MINGVGNGNALGSQTRPRINTKQDLVGEYSGIQHH